MSHHTEIQNSSLNIEQSSNISKQDKVKVEDIANNSQPTKNSNFHSFESSLLNEIIETHDSNSTLKVDDGVQDCLVVGNQPNNNPTELQKAHQSRIDKMTATLKETENLKTDIDRMTLQLLNVEQQIPQLIKKNQMLENLSRTLQTKYREAQDDAKHNRQELEALKLKFKSFMKEFHVRDKYFQQAKRAMDYEYKLLQVKYEMLQLEKAKK